MILSHSAIRRISAAFVRDLCPRRHSKLHHFIKSLFLMSLVFLFCSSRLIVDVQKLFSYRLNQDKKKHRGPSTRITPKSREFIETDSSSSSSECQSDAEEAVKIPALPAQTTRSAINTQTLSSTHMHTALLPCPGSANTVGTFGRTGFRVKDGSSLTTNGSSSVSSSSSSLSISTISSSFGISVPDPGGTGGQSKAEPLSPSNVGQEVAPSPLREYHEIQSLWVKIDLSLLSRVPGQGVGERSRVGIAERDESEGRDRERLKPNKGERQVEENERLVLLREGQADRDDRDRFGFAERDRTRDREKICQGLGILDNPSAQEHGNPRPSGRGEAAEGGAKNRRQSTANTPLPVEKHASKSKRKHKVCMTDFPLQVKSQGGYT